MDKMIKLRAQAKKAGVPNYGSMSRQELQDALAGNGSKPKSNKRKSSGSKRKVGVVVTKPKAASKPKRKQVAKPKATAKPKRKSASKPKAASTRKRVTKAASNGDAGRNLIDRTAIDWTAEWTGGQTGNRGIIMKALRRFKGDYAKVLKNLLPNVTKMYPKSTKTGKRYSKAEATALLKWHIGRTAFDFVTGTGQHEKATNRKPDKRTNGKPRKSATVASDNGVAEMSDQKLRKLVKQYEGKRGRKPAVVHEAMSELEKRSKAKAKGKVGRKPAARQTRSQGRKRASSRRKVKA